jgi:hypothetical protein
MMRLAAAILIAVLVAFSLTVLPARPVTWLAGAALVVGGTGVVVLSVPVVAAGASLALIAYALALVIARPPVDPVAASALGGILVLLLALVHFAARARGAAIGPAVIATQIRHWLAIVAAGVVAAMGLTAAAAALAGALQGASLPVIVIIAALGALVTVAGAFALLTTTWGAPIWPPKPPRRS